MTPVSKAEATTIVQAARERIEAALPMEYSFPCLFRRLDSGIATLFIEPKGETLMVLEVMRDRETVLVDLAYSEGRYHATSKYWNVTMHYARVAKARRIACKAGSPALTRLYDRLGFTTPDKNGYMYAEVV